MGYTIGVLLHTLCEWLVSGGVECYGWQADDAEIQYQWQPSGDSSVQQPPWYHTVDLLRDVAIWRSSSSTQWPLTRAASYAISSSRLVVFSTLKSVFMPEILECLILMLSILVPGVNGNVTYESGESSRINDDRPTRSWVADFQLLKCDVRHSMPLGTDCFNGQSLRDSLAAYCPFPLAAMISRGMPLLMSIIQILLTANLSESAYFSSKIRESIFCDWISIRYQSKSQGCDVCSYKKFAQSNTLLQPLLIIYSICVIMKIWYRTRVT